MSQDKLLVFKGGGGPEQKGVEVKLFLAHSRGRVGSCHFQPKAWGRLSYFQPLMLWL